MYITKEVEIWIDEGDLGDFWEQSETGELLTLAEALEMLHDEHHDGPLQTCFHPACRTGREGYKTARELAERYGCEDPSLAALHAYGAKVREAANRAKGVYAFPAKGTS